LGDRPWPSKPVRGQANGKKFMNYLYIIKSLKDGNHYVGMTSDLDGRLNYHNSGRVRSTKSRTPFIIIYNEEYQSLSEARYREKYLKSYKGSVEKENIIRSLQV
jgi:putative endonuclease